MKGEYSKKEREQAITKSQKPATSTGLLVSGVTTSTGLAVPGLATSTGLPVPGVATSTGLPVPRGCHSPKQWVIISHLVLIGLKYIVSAGQGAYTVYRVKVTFTMSTACRYMSIGYMYNEYTVYVHPHACMYEGAVTCMRPLHRTDAPLHTPIPARVSCTCP